MTDGSDLPPELIAHIIDSLRDAQSALRQCSLVCRAWVPPSQRLLFHKFKIAAHRANILSDLLVGAPHLGTYIREISFLGPHSCGPRDVRDFAGDTTANREDIQSLFSFLPNITAVHALWLASSPFLFTNSALRQCRQLRHFSIVGALRPRDVVSPTSIFPSFEGTTVEILRIEHLDMPSTMDSLLNADLPVCAIGRLSLNVRARNFSVWLPYFERVLPQWRKLKVTVDVSDGVLALIHWSDSLRTSNLSGLNQFHLHLHIHTARTVVHFPWNRNLLSAPSDHLLLTAKLLSHGEGKVLHPQIVFDMVEWYLCTFTALARGGDCTLKRITLTANALRQSTTATTWTKIDDTLSSPAFNSLEQVYFLTILGCPIRTQSKPKVAHRLREILPKLSRSGKLAV